VKQPSAWVIAGYAVVAVAALVASVVLADPWGALFFMLGVVVAAVGFITLVWSRVDIPGILRVMRRQD
jgi:peptidoglycan/LPS O-acetylase OafA/YrhL